jgi:hypothetical protein
MYIYRSFIVNVSVNGSASAIQSVPAMHTEHNTTRRKKRQNLLVC